MRSVLVPDEIETAGAADETEASVAVRIRTVRRVVRGFPAAGLDDSENLPLIASSSSSVPSIPPLQRVNTVSSR